MDIRDSRPHPSLIVSLSSRYFMCVVARKDCVRPEGGMLQKSVGKDGSPFSCESSREAVVPSLTTGPHDPHLSTPLWSPTVSDDLREGTHRDVVVLRDSADRHTDALL